MMKRFLFLLCTLTAFTACNEDDSPDEPTFPGKPKEIRGPFDRTVLVYISGENNLSTFIKEELKEMRTGSVGIGNNALVVYVDDANRQVLPYVLWIRDGQTVDSMTVEKDELSSDPEVLGRILNYTSTYYPAREYGLVLWGHCSGWILEDSIPSATAPTMASPRRAYGVDTGDNTLSTKGKWINTYTLAQTLKNWGHLKFIFADCCQFQCIENAYELKDVTDYIIGSPAEVPGQGAPYHTIMEGLFSPSEKFYEIIADRYYEQTIHAIGSESGGWDSYHYDAQTPISVIRTLALPSLAESTHQALSTFLPLTNGGYPDMSSLIYYRGNIDIPGESVMYDMNDFLLHYTDSATYADWKKVYDQAVIYKCNAKNGWMTSGQIPVGVFKYLTDERYGGVSMFVPQDRKGTRYEPYYHDGVNFPGYNAGIRFFSWYHSAGLETFGW